MKRNIFKRQGSYLARLYALTTTLKPLLKNLNRRWQKQLPLYLFSLFSGLFWALCLELVWAPAVFASTSSDLRELSRTQIGWATGLILVATVLTIYLFILVFAPEKF
jgi:hypothetical protein